VPEPLPGIAATLRERTRAQHDRIEAALRWKTRASDRGRYGEWLARLHSFYARWEPAIAASLCAPDFVDPRRKLPLLEQDLTALGVAPLPPAGAPPYPFVTPAEALGALYVLEGSTLGGLLIAAHVRRSLGHAPAFHGGYGRSTAAMWRRFQAELDARVDSAMLDDSVAAADRTFADLRTHLTG